MYSKELGMRGLQNNIASSKTIEIVSEGSMRAMIMPVRGQQVMLDKDLAILYGVETRVMNQSVKRNEERFPERFRFKLTQDEMDELITNCDKSGRLKHYPGLPYVFTQQGIAMLASVLRSVTAVAVSVRIMDAFVAMRRTLAALVPVTQMLKDIQQKQMLGQANILIDNWATAETLDLFSKKRKGVDNVANVTMLPFINFQFPVEEAA